MKSKLIGVLVVATSLHAGIITFTGRDAVATTASPHPNADSAAASFAAALGGSTLVDFENLSVGTANPINPVPGLTVSFINLENNTVRTGGSVTSGFNTTVGGSKYIPVDSLNTSLVTDTVFTFTTPVNAFGAYFTGAGNTNGGVSLIFNDGLSQTLQVEASNAFTGQGGVRFFGFTDFGSSVSSIKIEVGTVGGTSDDILGVDDVRFSSAAESPEPGTAVLIVSAVLVLGFRRRVWNI